MPQGATRINKALSNIAWAYENSDYIFKDVVIDVNVVHDSGSYWIIDPAFSFRLPETLRANGTPARMATWQASTSSYVVTEHALKDVITQTDRDNSDMDLDKITTEYLTDKIMMRQEYETHQLLFTTTTYSNNATLTSVTSWKYHTTTSAPIQNVLSATTYIQRASGKRANKMVMGVEVFNALKENPNVYGRLAYTERQLLSEEIIASVMDVGKVHVGRAVTDASQEGESTDAGDIWGADCLVGYFDPSPGGKKATAACMFRVARKGKPYRVKKFYEEDVEGDYIEVQTKFKPRAVATACGYLFKTAAL